MPKRRPSAAQEAGTPAPHAIRQGLIEAPTFHPTEAEFANPLRYILSVREEAEKYGICCIKPPPSWRPPFMIDLNRLKFPTRVQKINELLVRRTQRLKFMKALTEFCDAAGSPLSKIPAVSGKELDLHLFPAPTAPCRQRDAASRPLPPAGLARRGRGLLSSHEQSCRAHPASSPTASHQDGRCRPR